MRSARASELPRRTLPGLLALGMLAAPVNAQPRPPTIVLGFVVRADASAATRSISLHRSEIVRCFDEATRRAPDALASLRRVEITLRLDREGRASSVVIAPPLLSPGLSECLATTLLTWRQGGRTQARAIVRLVVTR